MSYKRKRSMHEANIYGNGLDFEEILQHYGSRIAPYITYSTSGTHFAWKDPKAMRTLTEVLLERDFGLTVKCHAERLCPALPNRINYLCWINDLLEHWPQKNENIHILDIGVGALAIYPILGNKKFGWRFTGSDIDEEALSWARSNVLNKDIKNLISLVKTERSDACQEIFVGKILDDDKRECFPDLQSHIIERLTSLRMENTRGPIRKALMEMRGEFPETVTRCEKDLVADGTIRGTYLFDPAEVSESPEPIMASVMANPPFYDLDEVIMESPHSVCTGSELEMRTLGGEVAFVATLILDSLILRKAVGWYTSMVGKKKSLHRLRAVLGACGVPKIHTTRFEQGRTMRWGLAWSFHESSPPLAIHVKRVKFTGRQWSSRVALTMKGLRDTMTSDEGLAHGIAFSFVSLASARMESSLRSLIDLTESQGYVYKHPRDEIDGVVDHALGLDDRTIYFQTGLQAFRTESDHEGHEADLLFRIDLQLCGVSHAARDSTSEKGELEAMEVHVCVTGGSAEVTTEDVPPNRVLSIIGAGLLRNNRRWRRVLGGAKH